jgi:hypothetical protein
VSSLFDSAVYQRRKQTPWARMALLAFAHEMAYNEQTHTSGGTKLDEPRPGHVTVTITYRHDVSSRFWYEIEWIDEEGRVCSTASQDFDLMLWRAAQHVLAAREKEALREAKEKGRTLQGKHMRAPGDFLVEVLSYCYDPHFQRNLACVAFLDGERQGQTTYLPYDDLKDAETPA